MSFSGKDFAELAEVWGIEKESEFLGDQTVLDEIEEHIWDSFDEATQELDQDTKKDMLEFITRLETQAREYTYEWPVWASLKMIDDDFALCQFFCRLLPLMWV